MSSTARTTSSSVNMRVAQIYHMTMTDTEQIAWCLDANSDTVCLRTPMVFSILVEALSVENPAKATLTERSKNVLLTPAIFRAFLSERKNSLKSLSIISVEQVMLSDIYFYQGGHKKPYLRVSFGSQRGFSRFRDLFQGKIVETEEEEITPDTAEIPNEDAVDSHVPHPVHLALDADDVDPISVQQKQHRNVMLVTDGLFARFRILESDIAPYWHWLIKHGIRAASTILIPNDAILVRHDDPMRVSYAHREYSGVTDVKLSPDGDLAPSPTILTWDIESLSENPARFPNACALGDVAFFISAYIKKYNAPDSTARRVGIYLVDSLDTLGLSEPRLADGTELIIVQNEEDMLMAFWNLIREAKPQVLLGYNTMGFDSRYLHYRMMIHQLAYPNLSLMRDHIVPTTQMKQFTWSSSAYKAVECWYYDAPGLLVLDMFVELKRNESLKAYTLDAVSEFFLKEHKVDLKAKEMFLIYLAYLRGERTATTRNEMRRIAEYGMQDAVLPARIFEHRTQWVTYTQMASIMGVGVMDLITRGQTLRTKANIYRTARDMGFIINVPRDKPTFTGKFRGAYVCKMEPGLYKDVIVYDFASLYPSTIAALNLSYDCFLHPRDWAMYPSSTYNSFMVTMGPGQTREVRYVKASIHKGILPIVVEGFLSARAATRKELKDEGEKLAELNRVLKEEIDKTDKADKTKVEELKTKIEISKTKCRILDKRQAAIKVSNNSVYGAVGADFSSKISAHMSDVCASALGLKWIAMTVTEIGQILIKGCTSFLVKKYGATPVYGDTDSTFFTLPNLEPPEDGSTPVTLWKRAEAICEEYNKTLPKPLRIELEKIIDMIGLTAKRYIYRCQREDGTLKQEINYKGVSACRRDTCMWQVFLFSEVSAAILRHDGREKVTQIIYRAIADIMRGRVPTKRLLVGCSVAESYKAATCRMAVLKDRMADLGRPIAGGSRVEFVVTQSEIVPGPMDQLLAAKSETPLHVKYKTPYWRGPRGGVNEDNVSRRVRLADEVVEGVTKIDYAYYVAHLAQKAIDQLFRAAYNGDCVIEPLVDPLRFDTERTLTDIELLLTMSITTNE